MTGNYDSLTITEATAIQNQLRDKVQIKPLTKPIRTIAGADISLNRFSEIIYAGIVVLRYDDLQPLAYSLVEDVTRFPYVPGFLAFREIPALVKCINQLPELPDVIMVDGHGIAHPRRMGIAAHLGALTSIPTLGCAKKILHGKFEEPGVEKGDSSVIHSRGEEIGFAVRTKSKTLPMFVSPGNLMSLEDSRAIALHCARGYRLPEPTRRAHEFVNLFRTGKLKQGHHQMPASRF